jgi:hypothetical protein
MITEYGDYKMRKITLACLFLAALHSAALAFAIDQKTPVLRDTPCENGYEKQLDGHQCSEIGYCDDAIDEECNNQCTYNIQPGQHCCYCALPLTGDPTLDLNLFSS